MQGRAFGVSRFLLMEWNSGRSKSFTRRQLDRIWQKKLSRSPRAGTD